MNRTGIGIAVVVMAACTIGSSLAATATLLTPADIKATFATGKPFTAASVSGTAFTFTFNPDGTAIQALKGRTSVSDGTWRLSHKGYCTRWSGGVENCYTVEQNLSLIHISE